MKRCTKCGKRQPFSAFQPLGKAAEPDKRHSHCKSCCLAHRRLRTAASRRWIREYAAGWRRKNRRLVDSANTFIEHGGKGEFRLMQYYRMRHEAILAYGGYRCACCRTREALFLTIDHVNGGGVRHYRQVGTSTKFFHWLRDNGYPDGFQVLCSNCNSGRYRNGGICPHKDPVREKRRR